MIELSRASRNGLPATGRRSRASSTPVAAAGRDEHGGAYVPECDLPCTGPAPLLRRCSRSPTRPPPGRLKTRYPCQWMYFVTMLGRHVRASRWGCWSTNCRQATHPYGGQGKSRRDRRVLIANGNVTVRQKRDFRRDLQCVPLLDKTRTLALGLMAMFLTCAEATEEIRLVHKTLSWRRGALDQGPFGLFR